MSNLSFAVTTPSGHTTTISTLSGHVQEGDTVTAKFSVNTPATLTLVAYTAPNGDFDTTNLQEQKIFSEASVTASGSETLKVTGPDGYFQIDFVAGLAIDHLATNPNVLYHAQERFIDGATGGTQADALSVSPGQSSTVTSPVLTPSGNTTLSTSTTPISMVNSDMLDPATGVARKH